MVEEKTLDLVVEPVRSATDANVVEESNAAGSSQ